MSEKSRMEAGKDENGNVVLCAASAYEEKYYFNPLFSRLPDSVQKELRIICILFTDEIGGIFAMEYNQEGNLQFLTEASDWDYQYDEIGAALMIKEIQKSRRDLLRSLELFYQVVILGQPLEEKME